MSMLGNRYARALLDLAVLDSAVEGYQNELSAVSKIYQTESALKTFLLSPENDRSAKKNVLLHVFGGAARKNILNLLLLLLDKERMESLPDISAAYDGMADEYRNILNITVTTALTLSNAQIDRIREKFKAMYHGSSVKITVKSDPSMIGGVKVTVGDKLYDGTVKGKLSKMRSALADSN